MSAVMIDRKRKRARTGRGRAEQAWVQGGSAATDCASCESRRSARAVTLVLLSEPWHDVRPSRRAQKRFFLERESRNLLLTLTF